MREKRKSEEQGEKKRKKKKKKKKELEISGFEPEASRMQSERSTAELYPQLEKTRAISLVLFVSAVFLVQF